LNQPSGELGNEIAGSDDHAGDGDQLIDVLRVEAAHVLGVVRVVRPHLDLVLQLRLGKLLEEHLVDGHVEGGDDLLGVADELAVQILVELVDVAAVHVEEGILEDVDLGQTLEVVGLLGVEALEALLVCHGDVHEGVDKALELVLAVVDLDVCAPDDHGGGVLAVLTGWHQIAYGDNTRGGHSTLT